MVICSDDYPKVLFIQQSPSQVYTFLMGPNCIILRCEDPSFRWAASIKSIYSTKPRLT
ncbi:hypothetical protein [Candidatus Symbiopectobacterium sp.]|uniref:hypothetical protein n=1 Tax=Candidatus Symbiopectobacterium sp. TaxID=2816440 RepID=UPI0025C424F3|nr:hypothetical protein [Candidatus Symbiopectobacterium sp.]